MDSYPEAQERVQVRISGPIFIGAAVVVAFLLFAAGVDFSTELMWFESLGLGNVFLTAIYARSILFVIGGLLFIGLFALNVYVARRLAYQLGSRPRRPSSGTTWEDLLAQVGAQVARRGDYTRLINLAILIGGLVLALFMGLLAAGNWVVALQFLHRTPFGIPDPAFGQDVGFYVFIVPAARALVGWLFMALVLIVLSVFGVYALVLTYELAVSLGQVGVRLPRGLKAHALALLACGFLLLGANHLLDMFELVRSTRGPGGAVGAMYTDVHAQVPAQLALTTAALLAAVLCLVNATQAGFRLAIVGGALWAVVLVGSWIFPAAMQVLDVSPNELDRERPYLSENIQATRRAFGLDRIEEREVAFEDAVPANVAVRELSTVNNIRLWDHRPLKDTYNQIQSIRTYYQFDDVDVDRYTINGEYRQVMLAARELDPDRLPRETQSWVSRQLQYTHGYGVAMSRVNVISQEGLPELTIRDVPPVGPIPIQRPEVYFGERTHHYVITRTATPEFDYPQGDEGVFTTYASDAGISVGGAWERLLFAVKFQDPNFFLNSSLRPESRLLYRRDVDERARQIAPFLRLDHDPYVVVADGGLYWIQDGYTVTDRYPYSQSVRPDPVQPGQRPRAFNYIRNSVKVVTSAYDGSIRFYVTDASDPLIQTYQAIFPDLFRPLDQVPPSIRAHFRYPEELFLVQSHVYQQYHMQDPRVFYLREDLWTIPLELFYSDRVPVQPYYVIMELPGESRVEFVLIIPFVPSNRDNMVGWLAARNDEPNYGRMVIYKYPKDKLVFGPLQLETRIDQDPAISAQFSLWNQAGSKVIRGNLLVIPMGQSNLYVEPIYLQATASPLPELKRVVVSTGSRIVMEPTLEEALLRLFGGGAGTPPGPTVGPATPTPTGTTQTAAQLAREAQDRFARAQDALRAGDFAGYGEELRRLEETLNALVRATGQ